jgi:hypothetical protein
LGSQDFWGFASRFNRLGVAKVGFKKKPENTTGHSEQDWNPLIHIPVGFMKLLDHPTLTWNFKAEAAPGALFLIRAAACSAARPRSTA